uniref:Arginine vasopressin-induced protein 1 n=1 Tax=Amphiprion percula TaxID=161767 RepID=A0A3P8T831_AMPPE
MESNLLCMPPFPVLLSMDTRPAHPSSSMRSRKAGSGNIFSNVNLWQLQRLFRAAGDQDAEQRAQLVWGHRDEAELAQALIGLRARSHRRGLKTNGRAALGSHWLQAFNHLSEFCGSCGLQGGTHLNQAYPGTSHRCSIRLESGKCGTRVNSLALLCSLGHS